MKQLFLLIGLGILTIFIITLNGCVQQQTPYSMVIRNIGKNDFSHSKIVFNNGTYSAGWMVPGQVAINVNPNTSMPDKATLYWQRENGMLYEKKLLLKKNCRALVLKKNIFWCLI